MPRYSLPRKTWQRVVFVLVAMVMIVTRLNKSLTGGSRRTGTAAERHTPPRNSPTWQTLDGCTLVEDGSNDGDSFVLRHEGRDYTFRLYFVDCPESSHHPRNGERLASQGRYFGGLSAAETIAAGEAAREFSLHRLRGGPVRVVTRWEPVFDSARRYALITVQGEDLAEQLVRHGLARIHTLGASPPGGEPERDIRLRLHSLERTARARKEGAWTR